MNKIISFGDLPSYKGVKFNDGFAKSRRSSADYLPFMFYTSMREVEGEERKHAGFSKTWMLPPVLETGVFSHRGVYSMKKSGKIYDFPQKLSN